MPAIAPGIRWSSSRWMIAVPTISSPWIAALTNTAGPGFAPCSTFSASDASSPVTCWLTGMVRISELPGAIARS